MFDSEISLPEGPSKAINVLCPDLVTQDLMHSSLPKSFDDFGWNLGHLEAVSPVDECIWRSVEVTCAPSWISWKMAGGEIAPFSQKLAQILMTCCWVWKWQCLQVDDLVLPICAPSVALVLGASCWITRALSPFPRCQLFCTPCLIYIYMYIYIYPWRKKRKKT